MHNSPAMQAFMARLIEHYNERFIQCASEKRLYLRREGLPTLGVVVSDCTVSVSLEEIWDGESYLDPEILFYTAGRGWVPISSSRPAAKDKRYARLTGKPGPLALAPFAGTEEEQAAEASFCDRWAQELESQGWLDLPPSSAQ